MLTPALVRARRRKGELRLAELDPDERRRALELAGDILETARGHVGLTRGELTEAWRALPVPAQDRILALGLVKLAEDACEIDAGEGAPPVELRRAVFGRAAEARRRGALDRGRVLAEVAVEVGLSPEALERGLFSDLESEHVVRRAPALGAAALVERWEAGQLQGALLRSTRLTATVRCRSPLGYRALFRALKFHRLLFRIGRAPDGAYVLEIEGPFALFESVTRYGLQLANVVPALQACDEVELVADLRWGPAREPCRLTWRGGTSVAPAGSRAAETGDPFAGLTDDAAALARDVLAVGGPWVAAPSEAILELPGVGLCVPDFELQRADAPAPVHVEVLGFWSREAVWRRIELVERGLAAPIVFVVSSRLRVSEENLPEELPGALYVHKGAPRARRLLEAAERVVGARARGARGRRG
ncbi:MAG: DUF790 family protein [Polyangiaceae bacterium]|nr:DUF790 family protein [Polyangiaceae bacterium]